MGNITGDVEKEEVPKEEEAEKMRMMREEP